MSNNLYTFTYDSAYEEDPVGFPLQSSSNKRVVVSDEQPWPVVMREFANFMSGIYGYNITEKLFMKDFDGEEYSIQDYE